MAIKRTFAWLMLLSGLLVLLPGRVTEPLDDAFGRVWGPLSGRGWRWSLWATEGLRRERGDSVSAAEHERLKAAHRQALAQPLIVLIDEEGGEHDPDDD